ncbi:MAG: hypothetical protein V1797_00970 [Pseudomonadota bacterium]
MRRLLVIALAVGALLAWAAPVWAESQAMAASFAGQARPGAVPLPGLTPLIKPSGIHWTPADPRSAHGAKGATTRTPAGHVAPEPNAALAGRADLYRSVPLPDPGFEFKSGPAAGAPAPPKPEVGVRLLPLPLSLSAGSLSSLGAGEAIPAPSYHHQEQEAMSEGEDRGGFLALRWRPGSHLGLDVGGGYQRGHDTTGSGEGLSWQMASPAPLMALRDAGGSGGGANYLSYGRWAAFMALPYQLTDHVGLRPEVSYYYGENPDLGRSAANEWVMGLQFTFGF